MSQIASARADQVRWVECRHIVERVVGWRFFWEYLLHRSVFCYAKLATLLCSTPLSTRKFYCVTFCRMSFYIIMLT